MIKPPFLNNQIYHIMNRGVEKRNIFLDTGDYSYMIHNLFVLNDQNPSLNTSRDFTLQNYPQLMEAGLPSIGKEVGSQQKQRKLLVEILAFTLMPNHFHLILRQLVDGGIVKFMQKLGTSTTKRFNKKYNRVGPLFQGRFKAVLVKKDSHLIYLPHYVHLNPLDILSLNDGSPTSIKLEEKMEALGNYKWSSFPDYIGKENFPSVTQREFLLGLFGGTDGYKQDIGKFLQQDEQNINDDLGGVFLDLDHT